MKARFVFFVVLLLFCTFFCHAQNWDIDVLKEVNLHRDKALDSTFIWVTNLAAPFAYSIPVVLFLYSYFTKNNPLKQKSYYVIVATLSSALLTTIIKHMVNRKRPFIVYPFIQKIGTGGSPSFPSGHTSDAFTMAAALSMAFPKWYVIIPSYAWAVAVGYSRMDLGVHYPSDVIASVFIGTICAYIVLLIFQWRRKRSRDRIISSRDHSIN